ncbi:MAG: transcriptional repressor LexA [Candidatus Uhrbacteria bacterium]
MTPLTKKQSEILEFIKKYIDTNNFAPSYREIADNFGLSSPATIHQHIQAMVEKGVIEVDDCGCARSIEVVDQNTSERAPLSLMLPLVGVIAAGEPIEAVENNEAMAIPSDFVVDSENSYVLKVKGRSMIEDGIFDGDYVVIERNPSPKNGDVVVALLDNAYATLKRFYREGSQIRLQPANSTMQPIIVNGDLNIQGIVRAVIRKFATT